MNTSMNVDFADDADDAATRFHNLALELKLQLASTHQVPVAISIEEMFQEVQQLQIPSERWHSFIQSRILPQ